MPPPMLRLVLEKNKRWSLLESVRWLQMDFWVLGIFYLVMFAELAQFVPVQSRQRGAPRGATRAAPAAATSAMLWKSFVRLFLEPETAAHCFSCI